MLALLLASLAAPTVGANPPPVGWTDLSVLPGVQIDARYASPDNLTGAPLPGYGVPGAWLLDAPAAALGRVAADLAPHGYGLVVFDAYRPHRATEALVAWAWRSGNGRMVTGGYISPTSYHNRGMAIDLGLVQLADSALPDMGSPWDDLTPASHTANATGEVAARRQLLVTTMKRHGWNNYWREWWHFSWPAAGKPAARDVPYACFEPAEGAWTAPVGWDKPGFVVPDPWASGPCGP
jgi:D-alanyl-D-alanine dipeptidase